jgi:hypothetical protein
VTISAKGVSERIVYAVGTTLNSRLVRFGGDLGSATGGHKLFMVAQASPHRLEFESIYSPCPRNKRFLIAGLFARVSSLLLNGNRRLTIRVEIFLRAPASSRSS